MLRPLYTLALVILTIDQGVCHIQAASFPNILDKSLFTMGFRPLKGLASVDKEFILRGAEIREVDYKVERVKDSSVKIPVWQERLKFTFGAMSKSDFIKIQSYYSHWFKSTLKYHPTRRYQLKDFLPPIAQDLLNMRFEPSKRAIPKEYLAEVNLGQLGTAKPESLIYLNCWGFGYEILRAAHNYEIFYAGSDGMLDAIRTATDIEHQAFDPSDIVEQPTGLRPGDVLMVAHMHKDKEYLDHLAIVIDEGLYLEKAGSGAMTPIRLIDFKTLERTWPIGVFSFEWRRPKLYQRWQRPSQIFALNGKYGTLHGQRIGFLPDSFLSTHTVDWEQLEDGSKALTIFAIINRF